MSAVNTFKNSVRYKDINNVENIGCEKAKETIVIKRREQHIRR